MDYLSESTTFAYHTPLYTPSLKMMVKLEGVKNASHKHYKRSSTIKALWVHEGNAVSTLDEKSYSLYQGHFPFDDGCVS